MDPFQLSVKKRLDERKKVIPIKEKYTEDTTRLPFEINKTHQYLKQNEYERNKKALKKLTDTV